MKTNIKKCISENVKIGVRQEAIKELALIVDVLLLVDGYLKGLDDRLLASSGGMMTSEELRNQVRAAINIADPEYAALVSNS